MRRHEVLRRQILAFALGLLIPIAGYRLWRLPLAIAAVDQLSIVDEDPGFITIGFPNRIGSFDYGEYRVRIPKYSYPAYHSFCSMWHVHAKPQPQPTIDELFVDSASDY